MNTNTPSFVLDKDTANAFRSAWNKFAQRDDASAGEHLLQALLLGKDPMRAFTPATNAVKLANGHDRNHGLRLAASTLNGYNGWTMLERIAPNLVIPDAAIRAAYEAAQTLISRINGGEAS